IWQPCPDSHDGQGCQGQVQGSTAPEEGDLSGPYDMHDQSLSQERFHEPAGLEQTCQSCFLQRSCGRINKSAAMKKEPHQREGRIVEYGTHRSDKDHEELDCIDVPLERLSDQFLIHIVCGNSSLRKIIE